MNFMSREVVEDNKQPCCLVTKTYENVEKVRFLVRIDQNDSGGVEYDKEMVRQI
jgi:hypothetical protein